MIKLVLVREKDKVDITNLVKSVTWSGDINTLPRKLEVAYHNTKNIAEGKRLLGYSPGNMVIFYYNSKELFRGFIFRRSLSNSGDESFTAYDELIYATKNSDTLLVKNKSASDVIIALCKKFGISRGTITPTGFKIKKLLFENKKLSEIFEELLDETKKNTKKSYKIYSKMGKVYMYPRSTTQVVTLGIDNVISASNEVSIEDLRTQVMVTKGSLDNDSKTTETKKKMTAAQKKKLEAEKRQNKFVTVVEKDASAIKNYGVMQHVESVDEKTTLAQMKAKAQSILRSMKKPNWEASIDFIGHPSCITGYKLSIVDDLSNIDGHYYITSDSHTFQDGVYKMSLQISNRIE